MVNSKSRLKDVTIDFSVLLSWDSSSGQSGETDCDRRTSYRTGKKLVQWKYEMPNGIPQGVQFLMFLAVEVFPEVLRKASNVYDTPIEWMSFTEGNHLARWDEEEQRIEIGLKEKGSDRYDYHEYVTYP